MSLPRRRPLHSAPATAAPPADVAAPAAPVAATGLGVREQQALVRSAFAAKTRDIPFATRFAVLNLIGVALIAAAWAAGLATKPYAADSSGMSWLITVLFIGGLVSVFRQDWQSVRWVGNALVYLGMVGTVLGLIMTVSSLSVDNAQDFESFKAIVSAIYIGSGTALYTNLLASIGYLWLGTNAHLLARQEV